MKFTALTVASVAATDPMYMIDGFRGYNEGFHKAFYKVSDAGLAGCMDTETITNLSLYMGMVNNISSAFNNLSDLQKDLNLFEDGAEIMENLGNCHFEKPAFDILRMCTKDSESCKGSKVLENLTKNMFVLVGKITGAAETFDGFPAEDNADFREQMHEIGDDCGTLLRVLFDFHGEESVFETL